MANNSKCKHGRQCELCEYANGVDILRTRIAELEAKLILYRDTDLCNMAQAPCDLAMSMYEELDATNARITLYEAAINVVRREVYEIDEIATDLLNDDDLQHHYSSHENMDGPSLRGAIERISDCVLRLRRDAISAITPEEKQ